LGTDGREAPGRGGTLPFPPFSSLPAICAFPPQQGHHSGHSLTVEARTWKRSVLAVAQNCAKVSAGAQRMFRCERRSRFVACLDEGGAVTLAKTERVAGGDFGPAMGRPGRPALGPAAPLPRPVRVPVRLVGKASRPPPGARVVGEAGIDLVDDARPGHDRGTAAAKLASRGEGHRAAGRDVVAPRARLGRQARSSCRCPWDNWSHRRHENVHPARGIGMAPVELRSKAHYGSLVPTFREQGRWPN
jgi:hypothetical protein